MSPLHEEPASRGAGLPGVLDDRLQDDRQGARKVGVGEDDLRRLAAELQHALHGVARGGLLHERPDLDGAGERDEVDARMAGEGGAGFVSVARDDVERAFRQSDVRREARDLERGKARVLGRLQHGGVAHRERGRQRPAEDLGRIIPRDDVTGDAVRLAQHADRVAVEKRDDLSVHLVGGAAVILEVARQHLHVVARRGQRLAGVRSFQAREALGVVGNSLRELRQNPAALRCGHPSPGAGKRALRRAHRGVDVQRAAARDGREGFAGHGRHDRDRLTACRRYPLAVDEHAAHGFRVLLPVSLRAGGHSRPCSCRQKFARPTDALMGAPITQNVHRVFHRNCG